MVNLVYCYYIIDMLFKLLDILQREIAYDIGNISSKHFMSLIDTL